MDNQNTKKLLEIPLSGCFSIIILSALSGIVVNECRRSDMRYEREKIIHQRFMDSINATTVDTTYVLQQQRQIKK